MNREYDHTHGLFGIEMQTGLIRENHWYGESSIPSRALLRIILLTVLDLAQRSFMHLDPITHGGW